MDILKLSKLFEYKLLVVLADAFASILHLYQNLLLLSQVRCVNLDETRVSGELESIVDQVDQDLLESGLVSSDEFGEVARQIVDQFGALHVSGDPKHAVDLIDQAMHAEFAQFYLKAAIVNLRKI